MSINLKHPLFPNEDTEVTCGRHAGQSCTQAHDSHVAGLIQRDKEIDRLKDIIADANEQFAELLCARSALIEVLEMATYQERGGKKMIIVKTPEGEESEAVLLPREEVESVLERFKPPPRPEGMNAA